MRTDMKGFPAYHLQSFYFLGGSCDLLLFSPFILRFALAQLYCRCFFVFELGDTTVLLFYASVGPFLSC